MAGSGRTQREMGLATVAYFFLITFGLAWGIGMLFVLFPERVESLVGPMGYANPLFILMVYSPAIAGISLVWRYHGLRGLGRYFRRLFMWKMSGAWWVFLLVGIPACFYAGAALKGNLSDPFPFSPWHAVVPALGMTLMIGPMEEFGWRGVALPLLQRRMVPFWSGLMLGTFWAVWHLPSFFLDGTPQSAWSFGPFFVGVVAVELVLTPIFDSARGSILIPILYHFQLNGPMWPDAQPWDSLFFVAVAVIVVIAKRRLMFSRRGAVTEVLAPAAPSVTGVPALQGA